MSLRMVMLSTACVLTAAGTACSSPSNSTPAPSTSAMPSVSSAPASPNTQAALAELKARGFTNPVIAGTRPDLGPNAFVVDANYGSCRFGFIYNNGKVALQSFSDDVSRSMMDAEPRFQSCRPS